MQHAIGFVKPAGLIVDGVRKTTAGLRGLMFAERIAAERINRGDFGRVEESGLIVDFDLGGDDGQSERNGDADGNFVANFDEVGPRREAFSGDGDAIDAKGQFRGEILALGIDRKFFFKLVGLADELTGSRGCTTLRIFNFELEFAAFALGMRESGE